jgi:hypothetical protein
MAPVLKHIFKTSCRCCFRGGRRTRDRARKNILKIKSGRDCFIQVEEGGLFRTVEIKTKSTLSSPLNYILIKTGISSKALFYF